MHFFFSSRRRHTRSKRDWSSDVCSSDLSEIPAPDVRPPEDGRSRAAVHARLSGMVGGAALAIAGASDRGSGCKRLTVRSEERRVGKECGSRLVRQYERKKYWRIQEVKAR